jgi:hypothetical protein
VREEHREAEQERRRRRRGAATPTAAVAAAGSDRVDASARGHAAGAIRVEPRCDRPGCYERPRKSIRCASIYCGDACRGAVRRVLDRESKWLARGTAAGRFKRRLEYAQRRDRRDE